MVVTERQVLRKKLAIEEYAKYESENPDPRWVGLLWNFWRAQALAFGSSGERAAEAADRMMFRIEESRDWKHD